MKTLVQAATIARKVAAHARLLRSDPERFGRNVSQFTDPAGYLDRLLDVPTIRRVDAAVVEESEPCINILLPAIGPNSMTGGPNTTIQVGCAIARAGTSVRFVCCDEPLQGGMEWFWTHIEAVTRQPRPPNVSLRDATAQTLRIGENDMFLASLWTTAQQAHDLLHLTTAKRFLYLIQDYEPGFYPFSSRYAMALETYGFAHQPIVNQAVLADFLADSKIGRFAEPGFRERCITFEPALDREVFRPLPQGARRMGPRTLLVYARPSNPRNMLGLAVEALKIAIGEDVFEKDWRILAIGSRGSLPEIRLPSGLAMTDAPWASYGDYGRLLREADVLLCPMLSPHTSYPVLEMAASGGISVTTSFASKTAARLEAISPNIVAAEPSARSLAEKLAVAVRMTLGRAPRTSAVALPGSWDDALAHVGREVAGMVAGRRKRVLF